MEQSACCAMARFASTLLRVHVLIHDEGHVEEEIDRWEDRAVIGQFLNFLPGLRLVAFALLGRSHRGREKKYDNAEWYAHRGPFRNSTEQNTSHNMRQ